MKKWLDKCVPAYARLPLIIVFVVNCTIYEGARLIAGGWKHYDMQFAFEDRIPFVPWTVFIYFGCYLFWIVNYVLACKGSREDTVRFCMGELMGKLVCFILFLAIPTTMNRPVVTGDSIADAVMRFLHFMDANDNLFPSIHCYVSWMCVVGIRKRKEIPGWYHIVSVVIALAVCISTLTTKQHVLVDVLMGIFLAEFNFWLSGRIRKSVKNRQKEKSSE